MIMDLICLQKGSNFKKNHEFIIKRHGFDGKQFPKKIFIKTETGVDSVNDGIDLVRRNWILIA